MLINDHPKPTHKWLRQWLEETCVFSFNPPWRPLMLGKLGFIHFPVKHWGTQNAIMGATCSDCPTKKKISSQILFLLVTKSEEAHRDARVRWHKTWGQFTRSPEPRGVWQQERPRMVWATCPVCQSEPWISWRQLLRNRLVIIGNWLAISLIFSDKPLHLMKRICFLSYRESINNCNCHLLAILQDAEHISTLSKF